MTLPRVKREKPIQPGPRTDLGAFLRGSLPSENFVLCLSILYLLIYLLVIWLSFSWTSALRNLNNISSNMWPLFALVIGQMFVLIVGGIDLSQASIMGITSVIGGIVMTSELDPVLFAKSPLWGLILSADGGPLGGSVLATPVGIVVMLLVGSSIGFVNGAAVAIFRMPPFMVTLVSMMFFRGLAIYLTKSENVMYLPQGYLAIGQGQIGVVPYSFFVALILAGVAYVVLSRSLFGRWLFAVGKNVRAAVIAGIPTRRVVILAYVFSGFCAAAGSILYSSRLAAGRPTLGQDLLLDIIGAAVIGGISLFGGKGKVLWALSGVLFFTLLANSLNMLNLPFYTVNVVKGAVILVAALVNVIRIKILEGETAV